MILAWLAGALVAMTAVTAIKLRNEPRAALSAEQRRQWDVEHWTLLILCSLWWFFGPVLLCCWLSERRAA